MFGTEIIFRHATGGSPLGRIAEAGYVRLGPGGGLKPWRMYGRYALVYLLDGAGYYADTRGGRQPLAPGNLVIVRPDLGHAYGPHAAVGSFWHEYYLVFEGPVFDLWARGGLLLDAARPVRRLKPIDAWLRRFVGIVAATGGERDRGTIVARDVPSPATLLRHPRRRPRQRRVGRRTRRRPLANPRAGFARSRGRRRRLRSGNDRPSDGTFDGGFSQAFRASGGSTAGALPAGTAH